MKQKDKFHIAIIGAGFSGICAAIRLKNSGRHNFTIYERSDEIGRTWRDNIYPGCACDIPSKLYSFSFAQNLLRNYIYYLLEVNVHGFLGNRLFQKRAMKRAEDHRKNQIKDGELLKKATPEYMVGCKRVLVSSDYYPALQMDNVHLITKELSHFDKNEVMDVDGNRYELDAVIFATGFNATDFVTELCITGVEGKNLVEEWQKKGAEAYFGISVAGYPNLKFMVGPNTGLGHNSIIVMAEAQMNYIMDYIEKLEESGKRYFDLKPGVEKQFNVKIQTEMGRTVWASGCKSWYIDENGKNVTLWPGSTVRYKRETRKIDLSHFDTATLATLRT